MLKLTDKLVVDPGPPIVPLVGWIEKGRGAHPGTRREAPAQIEAVKEPAAPEFVTVTICVTGPGVSVEVDPETKGVTVSTGPVGGGVIWIVVLTELDEQVWAKYVTVTVTVAVP